MPRYRFQAGVGDRRRATTDAAPADIGNRLYTLSLPPGEYEAEDDEESGLMRVHRVDANHPREFVAAVPAGRYRIETDDDGTTHLYKEPDDEPVRTPILEATVDFADRATAERASLRALNRSNGAFWDRQSRATGSAAGTLAGVNERNRDFWAKHS